jgi:gamma-glutamylaminecyclotransferase
MRRILERLDDNGAAMRLFVYGTLMRGEPNHPLLSRARYLGAASTAPCFALADLGGSPALVAGGRTAVAGELYAVGPVTLARLDRFERHPFLYRRATIPLADGSAAEAYLMEALAVAGCPAIASGDWRRR